MKTYLKVVHQGKYGKVMVKPNHPQSLPLFWLKKRN